MKSASTCVICRKNVTKRSQALQCDNCDSWTHAKCGKISPALYALISESDALILKIECTECRNRKTSSEGVPTSESDSESDADATCIPAAPPSDCTACSSTPKKSLLPAEMINVIETNSSPSAHLVKSYAEVAATPAVPSTSNLTPRKNRKPPKHRQRSSPSDQISAMMNRIATLENAIEKQRQTNNRPNPSVETTRPGRERCLIIVNAPESKHESAPERILQDQLFLQNMVTKLFDEDEEGINVLSAFRLGKRTLDTNTPPRPLKVVLKSEEECRRVFSRVRRLKDEQYRVLRDLSPEDRIRMREAVKELKERRSNGETNLHIVDFRVVARRPRVVWHPVLILPKAPPALAS